MHSNFPILYDIEGKLIAVLDKSFEVVVNDRMITDTNGEETLQFNYPMDDPKADLIDNELYVVVNGRKFVIRMLQEGWGSSDDVPIVKVYAEATWYELGEVDPIAVNMSRTGPKQVLSALLANTGWTVGIVDVTTLGDFTVETPTNPLALLRKVQSVFGGELWFDTSAQTVNLQQRMGVDTGLLYSTGKNIKGLNRVIDTRSLVTRLYPLGANRITIAPVNGGKEYIENYQWYDLTKKQRKVSAAIVENSYLASPDYLLTWAKRVLEKLSMPSITYQIDVADLGGSIPNLGDSVTVYDKVLGIRLNARVSQRTIYVSEPWRNSIQLDTAIADLGDIFSRIETDLNTVDQNYFMVAVVDHDPENPVAGQVWLRSDL